MVGTLHNPDMNNIKERR